MLAEILKEKRKELNVTQQEIADRLHVTRQTVSSWEVGKSIPDISSLIEISELYGISLDYMLKGDSKVSQKVKKDTLELKFLRRFSTTSLIIIAIMTTLLFPAALILIAIIVIYFVSFKRKNINIITKERTRLPMKKNSNYLGQALTDALSVVGGVVLFYDTLSFFNQKISMSDWLVEKRSRIWLIIFCLCITVGRYWRYRKESK